MAWRVAAVLAAAVAVAAATRCDVPDIGRGVCATVADCEGPLGGTAWTLDECDAGFCCTGLGAAWNLTLSTINGGQQVASAAASMIGRYPYSWAGGNNNGPTYGKKQSSSPYCDDTHVMGFDCSGLSKYAAYQGSGRSIYHGATTQYREAPTKVPIGSVQVGDLVFYGSSLNDIHHVAIYAGGSEKIEASGHDSKCKGIPVRKSALKTSTLLSNAARYW